MSNFPRSPRGGPVPRALAVAALLALAACGQRGPLYLPTDPAAAGRPTLPQVLLPGTPSNPTLPGAEVPGNNGAGTANPVRTQ